jgi:hypothetical protein
MAQFMADREIQKSLSANMPYIHKLRKATDLSGHQGLFE